MKRVLYVMWTICSIHTAVYGQDFASKFMEQCTQGVSVQCQTVSPKMMEKLMDVMTTPDGEHNEDIPGYLLSKLKSARIITANQQGEKLFRKAERLIERNKNRFTPLTENVPQKNNKVFVRKHDEIIRELVMLNLNQEDNTFVIVNLTGDMDNKFMQMLSSGNLKQN